MAVIRVVLVFSAFFALSYSASLEKIDSHVHPNLKQNTVGPTEEASRDFWIKQAQSQLKGHLENKPLNRKAKNVIFFIGDGMGISTLAAARTLKGQRDGKPGENEKLVFEKFPSTGMVNTYCVNAQVADSACSATAYLGGVKGNDGTIGVSASVPFQDCEKMTKEENLVFSIAHHAIKANMSAGLVTTTRVTHASPAGVYAHTASRQWENDDILANETLDPSKCKDIAHQLVKSSPGKDLKVILGGGLGNFKTKDAEGNRNDMDLVNEWENDKKDKKVSYKYVTNRDELLGVKNDTDSLLGLFHTSHLEYHLLANNKTQPTLEEMTEAAIKVLSTNENGFFLFVEGGKIDLAHHETMAHIALDETIEMAKAVEKAMSMTNINDTLIVVSADHSHTFTVSGYPSRGNDILGASDIYVAKDELPYLTLSYANGPGYRKEVLETNTIVRVNITNEEGFKKRDPEFKYPGTLPLDSETHGGEDVGIFARGPWHHLFTGSFEQNLIPNMMMYALCVGDGATSCKDNANHSTSLLPSVVLVVLAVLFQVVRQIRN